MSAAPPALSVVVVGDDAVAAGMLALDLVQAGVHAHAASDEFAVLDAVSAARAHGRLQQAAVVAAFDDIGRTTALWQRLHGEGLAVRFVAAVLPRDRSLAEHESVRSGWLGVLERPTSADVLIALLRTPPTVAKRRDEGDVRVGDLAHESLGDLLDGLLLDANRGGPGDAQIRLESGGRRGEIAMVEGQLVHAVADADQGRHALERMFCWRHGRWELVMGRHTGPRTLGGSWRGMLAAAHEYARRVEESRLSLPFADQICQVRWERARPLPPVAEAMFRRVAAGIPLGEAVDGEGDDELEAFAALLSRAGRGAVIPREGLAQHTSGASYRGSAAGFATTGSGPARRASRQQTQGVALPPVPPTPSTWAQPTPRVVGGLASGFVEPAAVPGKGHRHHETRNYHDGRLLPVNDGPRARDTISGLGSGFLPTSLPEPTQAEVSEPVEQGSSRSSAGAFRSAGWFGINIRQDAVAGQARLEAMGQSLVAGAAEADPPEEAALFEPEARPTPVPTHTGEPARSLASWSDDFAEVEARAEEPSVYDLEAQKPRSRTMLWLLVGVFAAVIALVVVAPASSRSGLGMVDDDSPIVQTHRDAVAFVDQGRKAEAIQMLRLIHNRPGVSPEALLELAVLELERGEREVGRRLLHQYTLEPGAAHVDAARRLYDHVFNGDLAPH